MASTVEKKAWPEWFELVWQGEKTYEYRLADFEIKPGDTFVMREWTPQTEAYTGRELVAEVGHIGQVEAWRWDKPEDHRIYSHYILSLKNLKKRTESAD